MKSPKGPPANPRKLPCPIGYVSAPDGPRRPPRAGNGLPVARYDSASLGRTLGTAFKLVHTQRHEHATPWDSRQIFQFSVFSREE